ncbi:hypothetical protein CBR_g5583 [Chara braunii]|uniref:Reverse transcriptase/retrotransposon-derived protein RNase H-like domain-containing protein n=1 Tax=Chara braunii TaxID=69332 RepID=A0A388JRH6_CHABU|nr:hypothetical protein CBR_g5583 [Chara braunii]|eukprot:GBG60406.1 hypothetical protein CBR_g5583 [Chara braunii]
MTCRVDTQGGTSTTPYTKEEEEKMAAILQERKEKREAKKKALQEEQAAKLRKIEEEMAREKERIMKEEEAKLKEVDEEEEEGPPLQKRSGQYSGSKDEEMEKRISEWVANLSLGEEEEVAMYIPKDEQEAAMRKWEAEEDVLMRRAMEDEQRMAWKLAIMREKKRRVEAANAAIHELEEVQKLRLQLTPQVDLERKVEIIAQSVERLAEVQEKHSEFSRSQEISVRSMRTGLQDFARELVGAVGSEVSHRLEKTERFCVGTIEGVKVAAPKEEEARPRREPVKVKFPDSYSGKRDENFDNWEANVRTYVHLQQVSPDQQVLIAIHALKDEAASFARSLVRAANCSDDPVAYSTFTSLVEFLKLLGERFADVARSVKASDRLQTIHSHQWKSARALKGTMDELVSVPDHKVTETQLVNLFYRAMPEALRGHFFAKSQDPAMTYDALSREVVVFEARSASISTFWHKDLDKGKKWKGRTISGQVKTKDSLVLTLDEGSVDEIPYDQIEWGLEEEDSGVGQGRSYAVVAAGGRPQGGGRGQGQGGQASGIRFQGDQGVGGRGGNRQAGGKGQGPPQNRPRNRSPYRVGGWHPGLPQGVAEELKERMPAWAKMKKENKGQLISLDTKIFRSRVGALVDSGATHNYISKKALQKLKLGLKVQKLADPIVSILADNRTMVVEDYVEGVQAYFRLEKDGKVEKVLHSLTLLVEDSLPFDIVLGMDWGEAAGAMLHLKEHECRLPSSSGEAKTARLFHASGVENSLAHCCLSAPAFARLVKKEKLEEQVFVAYVRPMTEPKEEKPIDPAIAKLLEEFKDLTEPPTGVLPRPIQHRIEIEPGSRTPKGAVYRMSPRELEELHKQLDELLEKGWIRPSSSPFETPVLFAPKKEGELRMCIDYRGLNAITFAWNVLFQCTLFRGDPNQITGADGTWHATPVGLLLHADLSLLHVCAGLSQQFPVLPDGSGRASGVDVGWSWEEKVGEDTAFPSIVVQLEWSHADRRVHRSVVGELDVGEAVNPIFLVRTDEHTKHHLSGLMCPLRLPVRLWMPSRTWFHLRAGLLHESSPKCRHEASVAVADYVFRYTVATNPTGVQEACQLGSRGVILAREKTRILTQTVHNREDAIVPEAIARKWSGDIHDNGEAGFPWDRHRAQFAVGVAIAGLASSANFARVAISSDIGNEVGPSTSLSKPCNGAVDSEMAGESRVMILTEKASPKTTVSWDTQ